MTESAIDALYPWHKVSAGNWHSAEGTFQAFLVYTPGHGRPDDTWYLRNNITREIYGPFRTLTNAKIRAGGIVDGK